MNFKKNFAQKYNLISPEIGHNLLKSMCNNNYISVDNKVFCNKIVFAIKLA